MNKIKPQYVQMSNNSQQFTYGNVVNITTVKRRTYFDLGGHYNLIDTQGFVELVGLYGKDGVNKFKVMFVKELGYPEKGVSIDLECDTDEQEMSVAYVDTWITTTVDIVTDIGRRHKLTQVKIGVIPRN